jgi:hypothetical protein
VSQFWGTAASWSKDVGLLLVVVMLFPVAIVIVGMPVVLIVRAVLEIFQRL